jgi:PGF-pre-PGF domain-containing protein
VIEFDFIPEKSGIAFNYRFGSEESFGSTWDDAFGLFVNGENIALLPNGNPVSVVNIGYGPYYEAGPLNNCFNGFSIVLHASASVEAGALNHMKFAIADKGDSIVDAVVFIEGESFVSNSLPNAPTSPLCEGENNPTNVTDLNPEFSWFFSDPDTDDIQSAYQIQVGTSEGDSDMWDSGIVTSSSSTDISYAGLDLGWNSTYYWRVKTWDNNNAAGFYCDNQTFSTSIEPIIPVASFTVSATSGTAPFSVTFNDLSTNSPTAWLWDFGDGATSTYQNPTHTYTNAGTYNVSLNVSNVGGYNVSILTGYITVNSASSGGSDSGRRVSVSPGQPPESVTSTYTSVKHVMGGTSVEYDLSNTGSPVLGISFDAKDNEGIVVAKVQVLSDRPAGVSVPPGKQYQLTNIDVGSEGTISSHNADNIRINFKVSWDWIRENNIDPATIRLTRYHDGVWQELPTGKISDDGQFIQFVAETLGFSIFSIVGDEVVLATQGANDVPPVFTEEGAEVPATAENKNTPGFTGLMGLIFVAVACVASKRSRP